MHGGFNLGRLTYRTAEEARGAARDLGLPGVHSHMKNGERVWMPGKSHSKLNKALRARNRPPVSMPGERGMSGMGAEMGMSMGDPMTDADMAALDGNGLGGELDLAGMESMEEITAKADGAGMGGEFDMAKVDGTMPDSRMSMGMTDVDPMPDVDLSVMDAEINIDEAMGDASDFYK